MLGAGLIYFSEAESSAPLQTQSPGGSNCRPSLTPVSLFHPLSKKDTISPFIPGYIYICVCVYIYIYIYNYTHFCMYQSVTSVAQSCLTLYNPMDCSTADLPVHHQLLEFTQTHVHQISDSTSHLILCRLLLLLPSIFPTIRIFSNESALCIRWPKY